MLLNLTNIYSLFYIFGILSNRMSEAEVPLAQKKKRKRGCKGGKGGRAKKSSKIYISVAGSSHATRRHYFPQKLRAKLNGDIRFECDNDSFNECISGRRVLDPNDNIEEKVTSFLMQNAPRPTLQTFVVAGNDLRKSGSPEDVVDCFRKIVQSCSNIPRVHILICGLIPSPYEDVNPRFNSKKRFIECNRLLRELELEFPEKVSFLDVASSLTDEHGDVIMEYYEQNYETDCHLSKRGCQIFVDILYKKMCGGICKF